MSRQAIDLIHLLVKVEENFSRVYGNISKIDGSYSAQVQTAARVLSNQEITHANAYRKLLDDPEIQELLISDLIYDKAVLLFKEFKATIRMEQMPEIRKLVEYAIHFEKENARILQEVLESVGQNGSDAFKNLLEQLINAEMDHSKTLSSFIKN